MLSFNIVCHVYNSFNPTVPYHELQPMSLQNFGEYRENDMVTDLGVWMLETS